MILRPHHLLCIQKYTGHGYSPEFTQHMDTVTAMLESNPRVLVTLTEGCDDICAKCPKAEGTECTSADRVRWLDCEVLSVCGFSYGRELIWEEAARRAADYILRTKEFDRICTHCKWYELCIETRLKDE